MVKTSFVLLMLVFLLAACNSPVAPTETALAPEPTATDLPTPLPSLTETSEAEPPVSRLTSECTLVSSLPDTPPEYAQLFAIQDSDWTKGPADAAVTIIEYSDFQ